MASKSITKKEKNVLKMMPINLPEQLFIDFNNKIERESMDRTKLIRRWCENWTYRGDPTKDSEK